MSLEEFDPQSTSSNNVESDNDSLFGDGDDADLSSLLIEAAASESDPDLDPVVAEPSTSTSLSSSTSSSSPSSSARPLVCGLTLPTPSAQLTLPVVPDPLAASLSHRDGHTSGGLVVSSSQDSNHDTLAAGFMASEELNPLPDDAVDEDLYRLFWDEVARMDLDQHINAPTDDVRSLSADTSNDARQGSPSDTSRIFLSQIHGLRYAKSRPHVSYSRRMHLDDQEKDRLWRDITLSRTIKYEDLYRWLELTVGEGKRLHKALSDYFQDELFVKPAERLKSKMTHPDHTKIFLVKLAFHMLVADKWGPTWFGPECATASARTLFWPDESTVLVFYFIMLLYRVYENVKQRLRNEDRRQKLIADTISMSTRSASPAFSDVTQPTISRMESCEPTAANTPTQSRPPTPTAAPSEAHALWVITGQQVAQQLESRSLVSPRKRSRQFSELEPPPNTGEAFFGSLVRDVAIGKKRKVASSILNLQPQAYDLEVPPSAKLTYYVYVKDKTDGSDLSSAPAEYRHTDTMISNGAFSQLMSSFQAAEYEPMVEIQTPWGRKTIATADEWDSAVFSIYNVRRSGGVVEVDIFV